MHSANYEIKAKAMEAGIPLWEIAKKLGMADTTFSRKLREEASPEFKAQIFKAIKEIKKEHSK